MRSAANSPYLEFLYIYGHYQKFWNIVSRIDRSSSALAAAVYLVVSRAWTNTDYLRRHPRLEDYAALRDFHERVLNI